MSPHSEIAVPGAGAPALSVAPLGRTPAPGDESGVTDARVRAIVIAVFADSDDERASSQALKKMIRRVLEANQALDIVESSSLLPGMSDTADPLVNEVAGRLGCTRSEARRSIAAVNAAQGTAQQPGASAGGQAASDVLEERGRQRDRYGDLDEGLHYGELARAGASYALYGGGAAGKETALRLWPWLTEEFRPHGAFPLGIRRNYVKATALLLAAIERLDRSSHGERGAFKGKVRSLGREVPVFLTKSEAELLFTEMNANLENGGEDPDYPILQKKFMLAVAAFQPNGAIARGRQLANTEALKHTQESHA